MGDFFIPGISKISSSQSEAANEFNGLSSGDKLSKNLKVLGHSDGVNSEFEMQLNDLIGGDSLDLGVNEKSFVQKTNHNVAQSHILNNSRRNTDDQVNADNVLASTDQKISKIKKELEQINNLLDKGPKVNLKSTFSNDDKSFSTNGLLNNQVNDTIKNNSIHESTKKVTNFSARNNVGDFVDNNQFLNLRSKNNLQTAVSNNLIGKGYEENSLTSNSNIIDFVKSEKSNNVSNIADTTIDSLSRNNIPIVSSRPTFIVSESLAPQALDLGSISTRNTNEILNEVVNYIERNRLENTSEFNMTVKHHELGSFKLGVKDLGGAKGIEIQIITTTKEGSEFFNLNENNLFKVLTDKGLGVTSLKLSQSGDLGSGNEFSQENNMENGRFTKNGRDDQSTRDGKYKREQIWKAYQESLGA